MNATMNRGLRLTNLSQGQRRLGESNTGPRERLWKFRKSAEFYGSW